MQDGQSTMQVYGETGMLKSDPPPHNLFLETSTPSDYILDDFTVLYLPVQGLCFFLNEEHERTCRKDLYHL